MDFKKGDKVRVYSFWPSGRKFFEGIAVVDKKAKFGQSSYNVCFIKSGYWCVRNLNNAKKVKK